MKYFFTNTFFILLLIVGSYFSSIAVVQGQLCQGKVAPVPTTSHTPKAPAKPKVVKIKLPKGYEPPVANKKQVMFPETRKKHKRTPKRRYRQRQHSKKGCVAAHF